MHKARHAVNPRTEGFALAVLLGLGVALAVFQDVADDQNEPDGQASDGPPPPRNLHGTATNVRP